MITLSGGCAIHIFDKEAAKGDPPDQRVVILIGSTAQVRALPAMRTPRHAHAPPCVCVRVCGWLAAGGERRGAGDIDAH